MWVFIAVGLLIGFLLIKIKRKEKPKVGKYKKIRNRHISQLERIEKRRLRKMGRCGVDVSKIDKNDIVKEYRFFKDNYGLFSNRKKVIILLGGIIIPLIFVVLLALCLSEPIMLAFSLFVAPPLIIYSDYNKTTMNTIFKQIAKSGNKKEVYVCQFLKMDNGVTDTSKLKSQCVIALVNKIERNGFEVEVATYSGYKGLYAYYNNKGE